MSATRFHLTNPGAAAVTPAFDAGWELTSDVDVIRVELLHKTQTRVLQALADTTITVPITTTQDILCRQFVSAPIPPQRIIGTVSLVIRCVESNIDANATLAVVVKVVSQDGGTVRGTLFSTFNTDTEFGTTAATRIVNAVAVTALTTQPGDRLVVEIGAHAAAPATAQTYAMRMGNNAASDFALTSGLTTDLNPWVELSQDLYASVLNNYQFGHCGDGMSSSEKLR